jgi:hypothetical protein
MLAASDSASERLLFDPDSPLLLVARVLMMALQSREWIR